MPVEESMGDALAPLAAGTLPAGKRTVYLEEHILEPGIEACLAIRFNLAPS